MKRSLFIVLAVIRTALLPGVADAFHNGGAGECEGCHTIHNSFEAAQQVTAMSGKYLLRGSDSSSVCLNCHQKPGDSEPYSFHISSAEIDMPPGFPPRQLSPGGDFGWLKKSYAWIPALGAAMEFSSGDSHGHNIMAQDYGYYPDAYNTQSPGGSYPALFLGCTSCHDPHGTYRRMADGSIMRGGTVIKNSGSLATSPGPDQLATGVYRLLGGIGYRPDSLSGAHAFVNNPPAAVAPAVYNRLETTQQTRVAYGAGMSDWCRNCHTAIHDGQVSPLFKHPAGTPNGNMGAPIAGYYSQYVKDGDLSGIEAGSWLSLTPFEIGTTDYVMLASIVLNTPSSGPSIFSGQSAVMCLSCHRAHASGWDKAMRWNSRSARIVHNGSYSQAHETFQPYGQGRSAAEAQQAYYGIPASFFAVEQNQLCWKCHATGSK